MEKFDVPFDRPTSQRPDEEDRDQSEQVNGFDGIRDLAIPLARPFNRKTLTEQSPMGRKPTMDEP